jgi:hypothetical protein
VADCPGGDGVAACQSYCRPGPISAALAPRFRSKNCARCELVHTGFNRTVFVWLREKSGRCAMIYGGFEIQSFEAGRGLWHARIQRADLEPVVIDGLSFPMLEVGFAWSDPEAAIEDAKAHIDRFRPRFAKA